MVEPVKQWGSNQAEYEPIKYMGPQILHFQSSFLFLIKTKARPGK